MRTIKFRAWCNHDKKFHYRVCVGDTSTDDPCSIVWVSDEVGWVNFDKFSGVIQQYTGVRDSEGVDIYEGDLIEYNSDLLEVKFENSPTGSSFVLVPVDSEDLGYSLTTYSSDYRVVGNIFENENTKI